MEPKYALYLIKARLLYLVKATRYYLIATLPCNILIRAMCRNYWILFSIYEYFTSERRRRLNLSNCVRCDSLKCLLGLFSHWNISLKIEKLSPRNFEKNLNKIFKKWWFTFKFESYEWFDSLYGDVQSFMSKNWGGEISIILSGSPA